jgi:putative glycerol-1-phosphate prenyltransferase
MKIYSDIISRSGAGKKMIAVLIDPDKVDNKRCAHLAERAIESSIDFFFIGSSIITGDNFEKCLQILKAFPIPLILFPGNHFQVSNNADALLYLSLISGRNPEMLIGRHVLAAPVLKRTSLEIISTGYMLIDSGAPTSVSYMSGTLPIPRDKHDIAVCTAIAGEMLGLKMIYLEAGSGAKYTVSTQMISKVKKNISVPLIVGGGINSIEKASSACNAGADVIVVGNILEKDPELITDLSIAVHSLQTI